MTDKKLLSVIIISRNEERNISKSIESVLSATKDIINSEIILVDSASTDRTVEIASNYPIKILQLSLSLPLSPGVGYYVGFQYATGDYIHFHCGDMLLNENWFKKSIPAFENDNRVGGVFGITTQEPYNNSMAKNYIEYSKNLPFGQVTFFAGDALFKKDALQDVGVFNPFLRAGEEGELSYRMIVGGYKLLRLPYPMSHHLGFNEIFSISIRKKFRYVIAQGQIFRYSLDNRQIFLWRLKEYKFKIIGFFFLVIGVLFTLFSYLSNYYYSFFIFFILIGIIFFGLILSETKKAKAGAMLLFSSVVKSPFFVWGFLETKKDPSIYLKNVVMIKS
jgi:glycosyltransferase involved in cell wall biosynthesis